jgi:hypothetical protein
MFEILTFSFLSFLLVTIASVFVKNHQEYKTIVSDLYHDRQKRTPLIQKNKPEKQYIGNYVEEEIEEEIDEFEDYLHKEGYEVEAHRDTIREHASWEDVSVEKERQNKQALEKLDEYQKLNQMIAKQTLEREASRNIALEMAKLRQQQMLEHVNEQRRQNKKLGVNSSQSHYKFKSLAEKGKLKDNKKTPLAKQMEKHAKASKELKHKNHVEAEASHRSKIGQISL